MHVRSLSWFKGNISWSTVVEELLHAMEQMGHRTCLLSTNGYRGMKYYDVSRGLSDEVYHRDHIRSGNCFDVDLTYTVPENFPHRFLPSSKCKMAIYAYESSVMPERWKDYYRLVDYVLPPSKYCADMFVANGCSKDKIKIIPHGVDTDVFNRQAAGKLNINTEKKFKFFCLAEPHARKQLDKLLDLYCRLFTSDDDVCFVLKTKLFNTTDDYADKKGHEVDLKPVLSALRAKYGASMPEIKVIGTRVKNIASLYAACDAFVLMTASEGWCVPYLEAMAMELPVIAPRFGGQLEYLTDQNSILTPCGVRQAKPNEQYWGISVKRSVVGDPNEVAYGEAMLNVFRNPNSEILQAKKQQALFDACRLTWKNAAQMILDLGKSHMEQSQTSTGEIQ